MQSQGPLEQWMVLRYHLSPGKFWHRGKKIRLTWTIERPLADFAGFILVANETGPPVSRDDGVEIFRWAPPTIVVTGDTCETWVSLEPMQQRRWQRFFCKVMLLNPTQQRKVLIIHPNTCLSISTNGEFEGMEKSRNLARRYRPGVPKTVICPYCFEEFPVEEVRFGLGVSGEEMHMRPNRIERLAQSLAAFIAGDLAPLRPWQILSQLGIQPRTMKRGNPPGKPGAKQGQSPLPRLCPYNTDHDLPAKAGEQMDLVIGFVGGKYCGKCTYIASLIACLRDQAERDFQAKPSPIFSTEERYRREFHDPLFENRRQLAICVGIPPPLIYDLAIESGNSRDTCKHSVTLVLCYTAPEEIYEFEGLWRVIQLSLSKASGLVFLIDPFALPTLYRVLPEGYRETWITHDRILSALLQIVLGGAWSGESGGLCIPVAVVFTKCDVLRDAGLIDSNRLWSTGKRHVGYFDRAMHEDMSGMWGEYLRRWDARLYNTIKACFSRHAFFGVSATGCSPDRGGHYPFISPWRVEDPLLWLLAELGVIPVR